MARKQRIQYPGAVYHVISRGNYRKELFLKENTGAAFERALMETVEEGADGSVQFSLFL
jgi:REP element-mobilizing transposase RayT